MRELSDDYIDDKEYERKDIIKEQVARIEIAWFSNMQKH